MPRGSTFNKKVYLFSKISNNCSLNPVSLCFNQQFMTCSRCYMVFNVQKIACEHLRDADCTTSMKVYKIVSIKIQKI